MIEPPVVDRWHRLIDIPVRVTARVANLSEERRVDVYLRVRDGIERMRDRPSEGPGIVYRRLRRFIGRRNADEDGNERREKEPDDRPALVPRHDDAVWARYARATAAYVPKKYDGSVGAFIANDVLHTSADPIEGWRAVGPRFEFHVVPGGHLTCITAHLETTGAAIDTYLERALSRHEVAY
jgi:hypothetical protein